MKNMTQPTKTTAMLRDCATKLGVLSVATLICLPVHAADRPSEDNSDAEETHYQQINLVSDISGVAQLQDTNLVNGWGITSGPTGPFWVSDNGTGNATLYAVTNDASGAPQVTRNARVVAIPGNGRVTGVINNPTTAFNGDLFIFASLDGTISGWRPALGNAAELLASRSTGFYTGIALAANNAEPVLLAANFGEGTIDAFNSSLELIGQFADENAPEGYAPYNVQNLAGTLYVTFAQQNETRNGLILGRGRGLIDTFILEDGTFHRF